jgi:transcriptional regulator with XRE-family HTH domain
MNLELKSNIKLKMKSVGEVVKEVRSKKKLSQKQLEEKTKIKKEFIEALESSNWNELPEYPVVTGFVKNIAGALGLKEEKLTALLRRDYPPKNLRVNPKPEPREKFKWSPRLTFLSIVGILLLSVLIYLGISYFNFIRPPLLEVQEPIEGQLVAGDLLAVKGKTNPEAFIEVNNQPVLVEESGYFETEIEVSNDTNEVVVIAKSRSGKETRVARNIVTQLGE